MSAPKYGPDDTWPAHQKPHWNAALAEARQARWTLTFVNAAHNFGVVSCPAGEHTFGVDQTARGGETKSKEAIKRIRNCQHGSGQGVSKVRARQQECARLLDVADELIAAAAEGLAMAEAKQGAQEDLDRLDIQLQTATSNIDEVMRAEEEAVLQAAIDVDDAPEPAALSAVLDNAAATVTQGESVANALKVGRPALAKPHLMRAGKSRLRIDELRRRLTALQQRIRPRSG